MNDVPHPADDGDGRGRRSPPASGVAKLSLGISLLAAAAGFLYFYLQGDYVTAVGVGVVFALGGAWEYRRRLQDAVAEKQYETDAERRRDRNRR